MKKTKQRKAKQRVTENKIASQKCNCKIRSQMCWLKWQIKGKIKLKYFYIDYWLRYYENYKKSNFLKKYFVICIIFLKSKY